MPASGPDDSGPASRRAAPAKFGQRKGDAARADRLDAALRENLKRRKAAARARSPDGDADGTATPDNGRDDT